MLVSCPKWAFVDLSLPGASINIFNSANLESSVILTLLYSYTRQVSIQFILQILSKYLLMQQKEWHIFACLCTNYRVSCQSAEDSMSDTWWQTGKLVAKGKEGGKREKIEETDMWSWKSYNSSQVCLLDHDRSSSEISHLSVSIQKTFHLHLLQKNVMCISWCTNLAFPLRCLEVQIQNVH